MPTGGVFSSSKYCTSLIEFQNSLLGTTVGRIEISAGSTKVTCDDANKANQIASAFSGCIHSCVTQSFSCQGSKWYVGPCGNGVEINVGTVGICNSSDKRVTIRPCIGGDCWGGAGSACGQSSTKLKIDVFVQ